MPRKMHGLVTALLVGFAWSTSACVPNEESICERYCQDAAACYNCGGAVDLTPCIDECVALSISEQRQLSDCARSCPNLLICQQQTGIRPPNPCF